MMLGRVKKKLAALLSIWAVMGIGVANADPRLPMCFFDASERYQIAPELLVAIGLAESRLKMSARNGNANGSRDICAMQVNSWWLGKLEEYGITEAHLAHDPCSCINSGAWILAQEIHRHGPTWRAVGFYNSTRPEIQKRYAARVKTALPEASKLVEEWKTGHYE